MYIFIYLLILAVTPKERTNNKYIINTIKLNLYSRYGCPWFITIGSENKKNTKNSKGKDINISKLMIHFCAVA